MHFELTKHLVFQGFPDSPVTCMAKSGTAAKQETQKTPKIRSQSA